MDIKVTNTSDMTEKKHFLLRFVEGIRTILIGLVGIAFLLWLLAWISTGIIDMVLEVGK